VACRTGCGRGRHQGAVAPAIGLAILWRAISAMRSGAAHCPCRFVLPCEPAGQARVGRSNPRTPTAIATFHPAFRTDGPPPSTCGIHHRWVEEPGMMKARRAVRPMHLEVDVVLRSASSTRLHGVSRQHELLDPRADSLRPQPSRVRALRFDYVDRTGREFFEPPVRLRSCRTIRTVTMASSRPRALHDRLGRVQPRS